MRSGQRIFVWWIFLVVSGCVALGQTKGKAEDAILAADAAWLKVYQAKDLAKAVAFCDEQGSMLAPDTPIATGKDAIAKEKTTLRHELNELGRSITLTLGTTINTYLRRLNAGFRIDYREPDYRGKEPAASYQILINDVPVSPRSSAEALDQPIAVEF